MELESHKRVRITKVPFNYTWPDRRVSVVRETGPVPLPVPMADAAIEQGFGEPFDPSEFLVDHERMTLAEIEGDDDDDETESDIEHQARDIASIT